MKIRPTLIALTALSMFTSGHAADDALTSYKWATTFGLEDCRITAWGAQAKAKYATTTGSAHPSAQGATVAECIDQNSAKAREKLTPALEALKTDSAKSALKAYHVAFVTALRGVESGSAERQISYDQRQQALRDKVNAAWAAFEVEQ